MPRFKRIMVVVEHGRIPRDLTDELIEMLKVNEASVTLCGHCEAPETSLLTSLLNRPAPEVSEALKHQILEELEKLANPVLEAGVKVDLAVLEGDLTEAICKKAAAEDYDMVAKLAEDPGEHTSSVFGQADRALFRLCPTPVLVVRAHDEVRKSVIVAVNVGREDLEALNDELIDAGVEEAVRFKADLHVVHAWRLRGESAIRSGAFTQVDTESIDQLRDKEREARRVELEALTAKMERRGVKVVQHLVEGPAAASILAVSKDVGADLMILGTSGRRGFLGALLGNTAEDVLAGASCSVLMIKAPGFVSPLAESS